MSGDDTDARGRSLTTGRYVEGNAGRPKGSRDKLSRAIIEAVFDDFEEHGAAFIRKLRTKAPGHYARLLSRMLPTNIDVFADFASPLTHLSDGQLEGLIELLSFAKRYPGLLRMAAEQVEREKRGEPITVEGETLTAIEPTNAPPPRDPWLAPQDRAKEVA